MDFKDFFSQEACILLYIVYVVTDPFGLIFLTNFDMTPKSEKLDIRET
jgi:hypothetical protein